MDTESILNLPEVLLDVLASIGKRNTVPAEQSYTMQLSWSLGLNSAATQLKLISTGGAT